MKLFLLSLFLFKRFKKGTGGRGGEGGKAGVGEGDEVEGKALGI